jgi:chemotaxis protein methyltransferase CheR
MSNFGLPHLPELQEQTFALFRALIHREMGIYMRDSKKILVANRLRRRLQALNLDSYEEYYRYLTRGENAKEEIGRFIDAISTNETYFYRGENQFIALQEAVLPVLFGNRRRLTVWSAGSSTGEEPYTIYMVMEETARKHRWSGTINILATDINSEVTNAAREGVYSGRALRAIPARYIENYFDPLGEQKYTVKEEVKRHIQFQVHNLLKDDPPARLFDIIFCRNVLIYFDRRTQRLLVDEKFAPVLAKDGYLFVGNSEALTGETKRFRYAQLHKSPIYRLVPGAASEERT